VEAVVAAQSPLVGASPSEVKFRDKYKAIIIAIHRHGQRIEEKVSDTIMMAGDTLLLLTDEYVAAHPTRKGQLLRSTTKAKRKK
jgi:Trk K+ transport system NAD-binding subunit